MQTLVRRFVISLLTVLPFFARAPGGALRSIAHAQSGAPRTVTLHEVLDRARQNPPAILSALATLQRVQAQEQYARGAFIPRLAVEGGTGVTYADQPYLPIRSREALNRLTPEEREAYRELYGDLPARVQSTSQTTYGRATVDYPILDMGRRYAVKSAHMNIVAQQSAYSAAQRTAAQAASELYLRSAAASLLVDDARLTLERRSSQLEAISGLVRAGLRPSVDATRAGIEEVAARFALETREIELLATGAALATAMGASPTEPVRAAEFDDKLLPAPLAPLPASVLAIERRPEVKQLEAALGARRADHRAAIGARLPTAGVIGQGNLSYVSIYQGNGLEGRTLAGSGSVYVRWSALDPAVWRRASVTQGAIDEAQRQLEGVLLEVRAEVVEAAYQVQRTRALLEQATQVLAAAEAARTAQNERYRAGVASLLDLLDAEGIEQTARRQRIEAERDQRIARVRLLAACGAIGELGK